MYFEWKMYWQLIACQMIFDWLDENIWGQRQHLEITTFHQPHVAGCSSMINRSHRHWNLWCIEKCKSEKVQIPWLFWLTQHLNHRQRDLREDRSKHEGSKADMAGERHNSTGPVCGHCCSVGHDYCYVLAARHGHYSDSVSGSQDTV